MSLDNDKTMMKQVFDLARQGRGLVSPNPMVGALIVKNGHVLGGGFHRGSGHPHAEIEAMRDAVNKGHSLLGATLYCNLEPCCHIHKKTPPCVPEVIRSGISRVVISNFDPNPEVNGKGVQALRAAGVEVLTEVMEEEGKALNEIFFKFIVSRQPFVLLKMGQTLDGKIATLSGDSKYITGENSLKKVHEERFAYDAILVASGTFLADNPRLTIRNPERSFEHQPMRIVICRLEKLNFNFHLLSDEHRSRTCVVTTHADAEAHSEIVERLTNLEITLQTLPGNSFGHIELSDLLVELGIKKITSVMVEGGHSLYTQFLAQNLYDKVSIFIAPLVMGEGRAAVGNLQTQKLQQAIRFEKSSFENMGRDVLFTGYRSGG